MGDAESTFHIALLFRPVADVTRAAPEPGTGVLIGVYLADAGGVFHHLPLYTSTVGDAAPDASGCYAHVIALQRATALSLAERELLTRKVSSVGKGYASFQDLLDLAFPSQENEVRESLLRFLPEFLGPIPTRATA